MIIVSLVIVLGIVILIIYTSVRNKKSSDTFSAYATSKGWWIGTDAPLVPVMQRQGYRSDSSKIEGTINDQRFWLYVCEPPTIQLGTQRNDTAITMLSVELPMTFHDLMLSKNAGPLNVAQDEIAKRCFGLQPLTLEGDFSQHFRLYSQNGAQVETLTIFTPDLMMDLESSLTHSLLFSGNYMSVWINLPLQDISTFEGMLKDAQLLTAKLQSKAQYKLAARSV